MNTSDRLGNGNINGNSTNIIATISAPVAGTDNYFCIVKIDPLFPDGKKIYGATAENAVECANSFLQQMLTHIEFQEAEDT